MKKRWALFLGVCLLAVLAFASTASAIWQGANFPRNGNWYTISGTYFNTPETRQMQQTGGPCSNFRMSMWRNSPNQLLWQSGAYYMCPYGRIFTFSFPPQPDYPGGVRLALVAGPADGQTVAGWVNGAG